MPFRPDRLRDLREAKGFSQERLAQLAGISQSVIPKAEKGKSVPSGNVLHKLACALDCTMDYLYGDGYEYADPATAATHMAFDVFSRSAKVTDEQRERCRRALRHPDAPRTAKLWHSLAEMMDLGFGPGGAAANLRVVRDRSDKSKRGASNS